MERTVTIRTELESIPIEQALAMARELELASDAALDGQGLAVSELAAIRVVDTPKWAGLWSTPAA